MHALRLCIHKLHWGSIFRAGLVCAALALACFQTAGAEEYGESLFDIVPPELMDKEAPFTEQELAQYLADYQTAKPMTDTEADKFFVSRGWREERLIYITVKVAVGLDALQSGETSALQQNVPKNMRPTKAERKIIRAQQQEIEKVFIVGH